MKSWSIVPNYEESPASESLISINMKLTLENIELPYIVDIDGWYDAVLSEGKIALFTCECGNFGCGGYYMKVSHSNKSLILRNRYNPLNKNELLEELYFEIEWEDVFWIYTEFVDYIEEIHEKYPQHEICIGTYSDNLVDQLDKYLGVYDFLRSKF
ncbi:hypothetical protein [Fusibacter sp. JL216-2]|uniref:hypothetical protein n=1 Tax=Fusibacter sp. JL216-2 TaxID=3071453 RepID=UPI003D33EA50